MKTLSIKQTTQISGGIAEQTEAGILATDGDKIVIQGMAFTSDGRLYGNHTGTVYHNFSENPDAACIFGYKFEATPVDGGYFYVHAGKCSLFG